jgi:phage portal protein BeeE
MGLLSYLRGVDLRTDVHAPGEQRSLPRPDNELPLAGAYTAYGAFGEKAITPSAALGIADVWACVRVLADAASSLPLHVYRDSLGGGRERVRSGRLPLLLGRPAPATSQADLISSLMAHLAIFGNGFLAKYREAASSPSWASSTRTAFSPSWTAAGCASATARPLARSGCSRPPT